VDADAVVDCLSAGQVEGAPGALVVGIDHVEAFAETL
jgi:hypothetical protein